LLYTLFAFSASTGDPFRGALVMFVFGLGTVPTMWGLGVLSKWLDEKKRGKALRFMGALTALWGVVLLIHGLDALGLLPHWVHHWIPEIPVFKQEWFE
ncbi:MAG: sulfite exporter TauE/SafE family protein, partial [Nitrospira sp.]|nr:sulfite exporter TauE/SafE family protein [Nitrospira sp.]